MAAPKGNKYAIGNKGGRPPLFKNGKQLARQVNEYFEYIKGEWHQEIVKVGRKSVIQKVWDRPPEPATITGLSLYLGFSNRRSMDHLDDHVEFSGIMARARARVEYEYEKKLDSSSAYGAQFALKNMGWRDIRGVELSGKDGKPIETVAHQQNIDYSKLDDDVLNKIINARKPELGQ